MNKRDVIVIGASAGGVNALRTLFETIPGDLPAAIFVVLHMRARERSYLPSVLQTQTTLPVEHAVDGEPIEFGRAYIAPPDRHLLLESGHLHLGSGPKENSTRPAINPLFRSAALAYGPRVIGIVLSGILDDGTAGLWEIKRRGGICVAQSLEDAEFEQMPLSAIDNVQVDYQVPVGEMGALLSSLVRQAAEPQRSEVKTVMPATTNLTCPDCHGPIQKFELGQFAEYRCRVGHAYGPGSMLAAHEDAEERALWAAIESLEEGADLVDEVKQKRAANGGNQVRGNPQAKRDLARSIRIAIETTKTEKTVAE